MQCKIHTPATITDRIQPGYVQSKTEPVSEPSPVKPNGHKHLFFKMLIKVICGTHKRGPFLNLLPLFWGKKHKRNTWNTASVGMHTFCGQTTPIVSKLGTILHYATHGFNFLFCLSYQRSPVVTRLLRSAENLQRGKAQSTVFIRINAQPRISAHLE